MGRLAARHGEEALGWSEATISVHSEILAQLVVHAAAAHGCAAIGRRGTSEILVRGPKVAVKHVEKEVAKHMPIIEMFLSHAALAYLRGADLYASQQSNVEQTRTQEMPDPTTDYRETEVMRQILRGFQKLGELKKSVDETRKRLPAPAYSPAPPSRRPSYNDVFNDFVVGFFYGVR